MNARPSRQQAADAIASAIRKADRDIYSLRQREHTMRPGEYRQALAKAKSDGAAAIRAARAELGAAIARERQTAQRRYVRPSADEAARATECRQQAPRR